MAGTYRDVPLHDAYHLLNHGPVLLISTRSDRGKHDIAPIAWACPVGMEPCQVLLAMDPGHQTLRNIRRTKEFIACIPGREHLTWVKRTGSVSGATADKFAKFKIPFFTGRKVKLRVPQGSVAFLECVLFRTIRLPETVLVVGKCVRAAAQTGTYRDRLLVEKPEAKTLHHLGGKTFVVPGDKPEFA